MGDGIGPEIMASCLEIMRAAAVPLEFEEIILGKQLYEQGHSGIPDETWDILTRNKIFLKAPVMTPQGGGYKSLTVSIRSTLGTFANVRPVKSFFPYVNNNFPNLDLIVIRENEEDLYAGIEHQQTAEVVQCLKLVSRPGCERIICYAFEYAKAYGRKKVTCMTKDNIMKQTDGLFHKVFDEVKTDYPEIESDHYIIDIGSARLAHRPEQFDVIVTLNLYGDIISDITAEVSGSVGLGGSANVGEDFAMFEAIHGAAPDIAGKDIANPSGVIHAAAMMLSHLGLPEYARTIIGALYKTIEEGIHTGDIKGEYTKHMVGTKAFTKEVIARLGEMPKQLEVPAYASLTIPAQKWDSHPEQKELVGIDVFLDWNEEARDPETLGQLLEQIADNGLKLKMITNRGVSVYPNARKGAFCTDHWRCRFISSHTGTTSTNKLDYKTILDLLHKLGDHGFNFIKTEHLYDFNGKRGYSLAMGEN